jgi:hypothetical protein
MMQEMENQLKSGIMNGISNDPNISKVKGLSNDIKGAVGVGMKKDSDGKIGFTFDSSSSLGKAMNSVKNLSDWGKKDNATKRSASSMAESLASSAQMVGMSFTPKQTTD